MQCSVDKSMVVKRCPDGGQSRLILLSLILHPVSQASHAPNHQKSWFWLMTKVIQQNTDQKRWLKWVSHHKSCKQLIFTNNQISMIGTQKMRSIQGKMKKDNGRQTEANQRRRPPGTEGAEIWANKSMMSSSNVEAPPKVWVSSYEDSNAS